MSSAKKVTPLPSYIDYFVLPLISIALSFFFAGLVIHLVIGEDPMEAFGYMFTGVFGYSEGIGYTLYYTTNFIFAGLAFCVAFKASMINIGAEGQGYIASLGASAVILSIDQTLPSLIVILLGMTSAVAFGAFWAFVPGYLKATRSSHEVITTIMFNFIANALVLYVIVNFLIPEGSESTVSRKFEPDVWLVDMQTILSWFGFETDKTPANLSFFMALLVAFLLWIYVYKTRFGFAIRTVGQSENVANYAGLDTKRVQVTAMCISGGLAGMMAINAVMGSQHHMMLEIVAGEGFVGIAVALIGRNHPLGIILSALLFGFLYQGGTEMSFELSNISKEMVIAIQGMIVFFVGALPLAFKAPITKIYHRYLTR